MLSFNKPGTYSLGVDIASGNCKSNYRQPIVIEEKNNLESGRIENESAEEIFLVVASPNPFDRLITVDLTLSKPSVIDLKIFRLISNEIVYEQQLKGNSSYSVEIDFANYLSGVYALVATKENESRVLKVIKR
jgi:hypothetical protein